HGGAYRDAAAVAEFDDLAQDRLLVGADRPGRRDPPVPRAALLRDIERRHRAVIRARQRQRDLGATPRIKRARDGHEDLQGAPDGASRIVVGIRRDPARSPARREAKWPLGLSSTMTSSRSIFGTNPSASNASRSSRTSSSSRNGTRANDQRSIGGIAIVVAT